MAMVLLVMRDPVRGDAIADRLEEEGHDVMLCPGPQPPSYVCAGARGERCVLAAGADAVVLDGRLAPDEARRGVPYWHLLLYYRERGVPVVALVGSEAPPGPLRDGRVIMLARESGAAEVATAVQLLLWGGEATA